eukprot:jgi/Chlat1/1242/Chrsp115S01687
MQCGIAVMSTRTAACCSTSLAWPAAALPPRLRGRPSLSCSPRRLPAVLCSGDPRCNAGRRVGSVAAGAAVALVAWPLVGTDGVSAHEWSASTSSEPENLIAQFAFARSFTVFDASQSLIAPELTVRRASQPLLIGRPTATVAHADGDHLLASSSLPSNADDACEPERALADELIQYRDAAVPRGTMHPHTAYHPHCKQTPGGQEVDTNLLRLPIGSVKFWELSSCCIGVVLFAGLMSGLTLGLMSLSVVDLEVLRRSGTPQQRLDAAKVLPLVKNQHYLLVTLLLCNAVAMEALPLFLDELVHEVVALVLSVTVAVCKHYGVAVGARAAGFVRGLMTLAYPIAYPVSKLLDATLGSDHCHTMRRAELKALVLLHDAHEGIGGELTTDEATIISGILDLKEKSVRTKMTPLDQVFMLSDDSVLDMETLGAVIAAGHSRIPVFREGMKNHIRGFLSVKNMIMLDAQVAILSMPLRRPPRVSADMPMSEMMEVFHKAKAQMAIVVDVPVNLSKLLSKIELEDAPALGIITLSDVVEALVQKELYDGVDHEIDEDVRYLNRLVNDARRKLSLVAHVVQTPDTTLSAAIELAKLTNTTSEQLSGRLSPRLMASSGRLSPASLHVRNGIATGRFHDLRSRDPPGDNSSDEEEDERANDKTKLLASKVRKS